METENKLLSNFYPYNIHNVKFIEAISNKIKIFFKTGKVVVICKPLIRMQELLCYNNQFIRIHLHRSYIVNISYTKNVDIQGSFLKLKSNEVLPIGNLYVGNLKKLIITKN